MKKYLIILFIVSFILVGCNNKNNNKKINNIEIKDNTSKTTSEIELSSDDTKIVFKISNIKYVFYYSDEIITEFYSYIDYGNNDKANETLETLQKEENMDEIYVKDNYVVIKWNENSFKDMTLEDVKNAYSYMEEIIK